MKNTALFLAILCCVSSIVGGALAADIEKVSFPRDETGLMLSGYFSDPGTEPPYPAVIFLHGCGGMGLSGSLSSTYTAWMRRFTSSGIAVLAIDSASPRGFVSTCGQGDRRRIMYFQRPGDAYAGLAYLRSRGDILAGSIGLMGWSQGGGIALLTIVGDSIGRPDPPPDPDFAAAVALYPSACSETHQSKPFTTVDRGTWSTVAPLMVLHGARDNWTPSEPCEAFINAAARRGEPVAITVYPNAAHSFDAPNLPLTRRSAPRLDDGSYPLIGTDADARRDAMDRVTVFFGEHLGR